VLAIITTKPRATHQLQAVLSELSNKLRVTLLRNLDDKIKKAIKINILHPARKRFS
jgi:hypothetical protein